MARHLISLIVLCIYLTACASAKNAEESQAQALLPQQTISINAHDLLVEIANTNAERRRGLAGRKTLEPNNGMLFVYNNDKIRNFTTAATTLKLSIAFLDQHGTILDLQKMLPLNKSSYRSKYKARYVLEVNQGWLEQNKIKIGDKVLLTNAMQP